MKLIPKQVSTTIGRQVLQSKKNAPSLLFAGGICGMVTSTYLACRATLKMQDVLENAERDLEIARALQHRDYSENDRQQDTVVIYTRTVGRVLGLYTPALLLGAASVAALSRSHSILVERNLAVTAAYTAVAQAFEQYRERVVDKYGEEQDREFRYETERVQIVDDETGEVVSELRVAPKNDYSMYARFFDELNANWNRETEYNIVFLRAQQNYWNDVLRTRGHVFLNEVYKSIGMTHTRAGSVVGWVLGPDSDNYIDFGIYDSRNDKAIDFVNGREGAILLDFNVDGIIYDRIEDDVHGMERWN